MPISKSMSNMLGKPFPRDNEIFKNDLRLSKLIKQCENYVELSLDLRDCMEVFNVLDKLAKMKEQGGIYMPEVYLPIRKTLESYTCYIIMLYAKLYTQSDGRTDLNSKFKEIAGGDCSIKKTHHRIMMLRNKYFAHHQLKANRHNIFYKVDGDDILLDPFCFNSRVEMHSAVPWSEFYKCIRKTRNFVEGEAEKICERIKESLTESQRDYLFSVDYDEAISIYNDSHQDLLSDR